MQYNRTSEDFALVSGFYGPGAIACWYLSLASLTVDTAIGGSQTAIFGLSINFIAFTAYPIAAAASLLIQIIRFPVDHEVYLIINLLSCIENHVKGPVLASNITSYSYFENLLIDNFTLDTTSIYRADLYPRILAMDAAIKIQNLFYFFSPLVGFLILVSQTSRIQRAIKCTLLAMVLVWFLVVNIVFVTKFNTTKDDLRISFFSFLAIFSPIFMIFTFSVKVSAFSLCLGPAGFILIMSVCGLSLIFLPLFAALGYIWEVVFDKLPSTLTSTSLFKSGEKLRSHLGSGTRETFLSLNAELILCLIAATLVAVGAGFLVPICFPLAPLEDVSHFLIPSSGLSITDLDQCFALLGGLVSFLWPILHAVIPRPLVVNPSLNVDSEIAT